MMQLDIVIGKTGAGKDWYVKRQYEKDQIVLPYTNRPPRPGEVDDPNYIFCSTLEFEQRRKNGEFIEVRRYEVPGSVFPYQYATPKIQYEVGAHKVVIATPPAALDIIKYFKGPNGTADTAIRITIKEIWASDETRLERYISRDPLHGTKAKFKARAESEEKDFTTYFYVELDKMGVDRIIIDNDNGKDEAGWKHYISKTTEDEAIKEEKPMKKVIKKGVNRFELRRVTCPKCYAELEFTPDAWIREEVPGSFMENSYRYYLNCPCCETPIESNKAECIYVDEVLEIKDTSWTESDGESL